MFIAVLMEKSHSLGRLQTLLLAKVVVDVIFQKLGLIGAQTLIALMDVTRFGFCADNYPSDPNVCLSWDFGDGNIYNPPLPECPIHCYNSEGVYTACLTVYCCDEGPDGSSAYTICHEVIVSCGCLADCPEFAAGLGLVNLGTSTDASGASCCEYGLVPELLSGLMPN